jgi:hypothetical protein
MKDEKIKLFIKNFFLGLKLNSNSFLKPLIMTRFFEIKDWKK